MYRFVVAACTSAWPFFTDVVSWRETLLDVTGGRFRGDTKDSLRTADVSLRSSPLRDVSRGETSSSRKTSLSGDERGKTSAVRRLHKGWLALGIITAIPS